MKKINEELNIFLKKSELNYLEADKTTEESLVGMQFFEEPLIGVADAQDELFAGLKAPEAVGPQFLLPNEWLSEAKSVISVFLPFSERVRKSNRQKNDIPSNEWLYGRIEGQCFVAAAAQQMKKILEETGYQAVVPTADERFRAVMADTAEEKGVWKGITFASNWSERHVAYISGLGTFGLSKGLITQKGVAGRFFSVVTDAELPVTKRDYTGLYEYCTMCGACADRCPANAIDLKTGKDHPKCSDFLILQKELHAPRYGCGKCQTAVPCEYRRPGRKE